MTSTVKVRSADRDLAHVHALSARKTGQLLIQRCVQAGIDTFVGVPCSYLGALFAELESGRDDVKYHAAPREDVALAFAAGRYLGGGMAAVALQNSGLGHAVNPLQSLHRVYAIPTLLLVGWRGRDPDADAPEHRYMGPATSHLLELMDIPFAVAGRDSMEAAVDTCMPHLQAGRAAAILIPEGVLS